MASKRERNKALLKDRDGGMSYADLSEKYGISKARVGEIIHQEREQARRDLEREARREEIEEFERKNPVMTNVSSRTRIALHREDVYTDEDLCLLKASDIMKVRNIGIGSVTQLKRLLKEHGLSLVAEDEPFAFPVYGKTPEV